MVELLTPKEAAIEIRYRLANHRLTTGRLPYGIGAKVLHKFVNAYISDPFFLAEPGSDQSHATLAHLSLEELIKIMNGSRLYRRVAQGKH